MSEFADYGLTDQFFSQFAGAELLAKKYDLSRQALDDFAALSNQRAIAAIKGGKFATEILPVTVKIKVHECSAKRR